MHLRKYRPGINRRLATVALLTALLSLEGCSLLPKKRIPAPPQQQPPVQTPSSKKKGPGWFFHLTHPFGARKPPPPKAQPLRRVGTVRTLSNDGSYVIVELEPGVMVQAGADLVITASGGEPAHLRVGEIQPPYFIADLKSGRAEPGDPVQQ